MRESSVASAGIGVPSTVVFPLAIGAVERVLAAAAPVLERMFDTALPSAQTLRALGDEVRKAISQPKSVAHPELADPDVYWELAAFPQAASLVRQLRGVLVEVANELAPAVEGSRADFDAWLRAVVAAETPRRRVDPDASRNAVIDKIAERCAELHVIVTGAGDLLPSAGRIDALRSELAKSRRKRIEDEAKRSGELLEVVEAQLRQDPPFRHQDLLLDGFAMAYESLKSDVKELVDHLTEPIFGLGERMVMSYDDVVALVESGPATASLLDAGGWIERA